MRRLVLAVIVAGSILAGTAAPVLAHDMAVTFQNGKCVLIPHAAGNPGPAPVPSGISVANPKTDAIVSAAHGGNCP